jgi:hypothetical protein
VIVRLVRRRTGRTEAVLAYEGLSRRTDTFTINLRSSATAIAGGGAAASAKPPDRQVVGRRPGHRRDPKLVEVGRLALRRREAWPPRPRRSC